MKKSEPTFEINTRIRNYGDYQPDTAHIRINPTKGDVVNTIIHERLHHDFPEMAHEDVYANAAKIEGKMSLPQMAAEMLAVHAKANEGLSKTTPKATIKEVPRIVSRG